MANLVLPFATHSHNTTKALPELGHKAAGLGSPEKVALLIAGPKRLAGGVEGHSGTGRGFQSSDSEIQYFRGSIWSSVKPREGKAK